MVTATKTQITGIIGKYGAMGANDLRKKLGISAQALHRHLRTLCESGVLKAVGSSPKTKYELGDHAPVSSQSLTYIKECRAILSAHPSVALVTLFGSQARGTANDKSDIDLLIWLVPNSSFGKNEIWQFWDRQARLLQWNKKVSLVVRTFSKDLTIDTLLLDFPEEHRLVYDSQGFYPLLKNAVVAWRDHWGSEKVSSFGKTHFWKYSTKVKRLNEIDFRLDLKNVA